MSVFSVKLFYAIAINYVRYSLVADLPTFAQTRCFSKLAEMVISNPRMQIAQKSTDTLSVLIQSGFLTKGASLN